MKGEKSMKRIAFLAFCIVVAIFSAACTRINENNPSPESGSPPVSSISDINDGSSSTSDIPEESQTGGGNPIYVTDAALYRGTITAITEEDGQTILRLEQAEGTNFGSAILNVAIDSNTSLSFDKDKLEEGRYLEVFYGVPMDGGIPDPVTAIGINLLLDAAQCVYNGVVVEVQPSDDPEAGTLLLYSGTETNTIYFHYNSQTQVYLNISELQPGDKVNIYYSGVVANSSPPQATAYELRRYTEPDAV